MYFTLTDGSHILHFNWMTNEPNNFDEKCLAMYAKEGSWIDWDCTLPNYGLCEGRKHIFYSFF